MAWRIVKQPNGKYARFSDVVDNFTHTNMTEEQALAYCKAHMSHDEAAAKVRAGVEDWKPWTTTPGHGTARFADCLETILHVHGRAAAANHMEKLCVTQN